MMAMAGVAGAQGGGGVDDLGNRRRVGHQLRRAFGLQFGGGRRRDISGSAEAAQQAGDRHVLAERQGRRRQMRQREAVGAVEGRRIDCLNILFRADIGNCGFGS